MTKYINMKLFTDIKSWMVYDIDEEKGTAMAIEVEKRIEPCWIYGGPENGYRPIRCTNTYEFNRITEGTPMKGAEPFAIIRNKQGIWGYKRVKTLCCVDVRSVNAPQEILAKNPDAELDGNRICWFDRTPKGAKKVTFEKLGRLDDVCRYYYDYNF